MRRKGKKEAAQKSSEDEMDDDEDSVQDVASHPPIDISDSPQSYHVDDESLRVAISRRLG